MTESAALDVDRLSAWLDACELPGGGAPIAVRRVSGGSQNEIFEVRRGDVRMALRKPPAGAVPGRDEGIRREWRIISGLAGTDVPHARGIALCDDASVLGRPFYLMDFIPGWSPAAGGLAEPFLSDLARRADLAVELVAGAARLGAVDYVKQGLADLGRPEGFHDRQVERWLRFYERADGRPGLAGMEVATDWLRAHRPIDFVPGIMHGDYQFANVMFADTVPGRLVAIIDWEMGTIGDPKLDLAWALRDWPATGTPTGGISSQVDCTGMPSRDVLLDHYARISGRQVDDFDYYLVLARWKLALILEQGYQNAGGDPLLESFGPIIDQLLRSAAELAETTNYRGPVVRGI